MASGGPDIDYQGPAGRPKQTTRNWYFSQDGVAGVQVFGSGARAFRAAVVATPDSLTCRFEVIYGREGNQPMRLYDPSNVPFLMHEVKVVSTDCRIVPGNIFAGTTR